MHVITTVRVVIMTVFTNVSTGHTVKTVKSVNNVNMKTVKNTVDPCAVTNHRTNTKHWKTGRS